MDAIKTSLSAGQLIRALLLDNPEVAARASKVYPIVADNAELPYITYRRAEMAVNPQKSGQPGADEIRIELLCFTRSYSEGVELAEHVRNALDYVVAEDSGLRMRGCYLSDGEEYWDNDAYVQRLIFNVRI